jgi:2-polyprenyl-3-methyl-5-hydroxy-6-metoxy-1,4-benzoquinol methylase
VIAANPADDADVPPDVTSSTYAIEGGRAGKARLNVLNRMMEPATTRLLDRVSIPTGATCLDVGCGGGHVTLELARRVGPGGRVVGIDFDADVLALARADAAAAGFTNVEFQVGDATALDRVGLAQEFDVVFARFLLSHVAHPDRVVASMASLARAGGMIVVEDIQGRGAFTEPPSAALDRYRELYAEIVRRKGGDSELGPRLPGLLRSAGLEQVGCDVVQRLPADEGRHIHGLTLDRIGPAVVDAGLATADEVQALSTALHTLADDPAVMVATPRFFQSWGIVPGQQA